MKIDDIVRCVTFEEYNVVRVRKTVVTGVIKDLKGPFVSVQDPHGINHVFGRFECNVIGRVLKWKKK